MQVKPLYFDFLGQKIPTKLQYRLDLGDSRWYYTMSPKWGPKFRMSATTFTSLMMPMSPFLVEWYGRLGMENATAYRDDKADKGTFMHEMFAKFLIEGEFDFNKLDDYIAEYRQDIRKDVDEKVYRYLIEKQMLSFQAWCFEYKIKAIAVEYPLIGDKLSGTVDLVADATFKRDGIFAHTLQETELLSEKLVAILKPAKDEVVEVLDATGEKYWKVRHGRITGLINKEHLEYELVYSRGGKRSNGEVYEKGDPRITKGPFPKRIIVDFKSGAHFYPAHAMQIHIYWKIWKKSFKNIPIDDVYNWSPSDWKSKPTFHFKQQTNENWFSIIKAYMQIAGNPINKYFTVKKKKIQINKKLKLGHPVSVAYDLVPLHDFVKAEHKKSKKAAKRKAKSDDTK